MGRCSQEVWRIARVMAKTSGDSGPGVSGIILAGIQDSFTTQGTRPDRPPDGPAGNQAGASPGSVSTDRHLSRRQIPSAIDSEGIVGPGGLVYGVAAASDACSEASVTQVFLRCSPRIAPVTLRTRPDGHETSLTKATS
jgi:hypothetical protein